VTNSTKAVEMNMSCYEEQCCEIRLVMQRNGLCQPNERTRCKAMTCCQWKLAIIETVTV
jgi:hypothetical protein